MFSKEVINLLVKVVSSWQVIAATIALLIYLKLVFFVASARRARAFDLTAAAKPKKAKKEKPAKAAAPSKEEDDLGIVEEE